MVFPFSFSFFTDREVGRTVGVADMILEEEGLLVFGVLGGRINGHDAIAIFPI